LVHDVLRSVKTFEQNETKKKELVRSWFINSFVDIFVSFRKQIAPSVIPLFCLVCFTNLDDAPQTAVFPKCETA